MCRGQINAHGLRAHSDHAHAVYVLIRGSWGTHETHQSRTTLSFSKSPHRFRAAAGCSAISGSRFLRSCRLLLRRRLLHRRFRRRSSRSLFGSLVLSGQSLGLSFLLRSPARTLLLCGVLEPLHVRFLLVFLGLRVTAVQRKRAQGGSQHWQSARRGLATATLTRPRLCR